MKAKRFLAALFLISCNFLHAQDTAVYKTLPLVKVTAVTTKVPKAVWDGFSNYFNGAFVRKWYKLNKRYLVKFMLDETVNRALFTKRGELVYHISYGYEKNLPEDLHNAVRNDYADWDITRAIKVTEDNRTIWVITMENSKHIILVRVEDGEMEEVEKMNKQ